MRLTRVAVQNVRSFLDRTEIHLDGSISILIGPNGGGKTNLLDAIVIMLRRHLFASMYAAHAPTPEEPHRYEFRYNDMLSQLVLEKHNAGEVLPQIVEVEIEASKNDVATMRLIKRDAPLLVDLAGRRYFNHQYQNVFGWNDDAIHPGQRFTYRLVDGNFQHAQPSEASNQFHQFLQIAEVDNLLREEFQRDILTTPMIYLPVNRTSNPMNSTIELAGFNPFEQKRQSDIGISRTNFSLVQLAIGRLAQRFRLILERDKGSSSEIFKSDRNLRELTRILDNLGYEWNLVCTAPLRNTYDIELKKQGSRFLLSRASSGEKELLTYLFTIFALNVRDALIMVDEPELHLHPKWQATLLQLFEDLSAKTGNQFLITTHSPTFVTPKSIQYVSRVYTEIQRSRILRLDVAGLPGGRHLSNIVNSQNNERIFFADKVLLVEGLSDQIFFEAVLRKLGLPLDGKIMEIVSVGGKGFFASYQRLLDACHVQHAAIADLDYIEQVGTRALKSLFRVNTKEIKADVIENEKSKDGDALVAAIDGAMASGEWAHAKDTWAYIKSRRRQLVKNLSADKKQMLKTFIEEKRSENVFLLSRGALEAYLPEGHARKDLDKLIRFVSNERFWAEIRPANRNELTTILNRICDT